ncbi:hypothetical protein PPERSA_05470 [Pseudocohnilembus persalinus]|uniref:Tubulin-tyrosine ligase family protein n=1 Tax=Pseudocohnilembus persalinus TaxID=266149 RepID=A0A0V0R8L8_PSEPJ|nr:hypothetical protein PPERSA_05470 [Pseudocohnilembus persalinus]|eukprot:KRX10650.1 hypothetical protein PPERSA_05470 [Pseudocohnilembus persalinus]
MMIKFQILDGTFDALVGGDSYIKLVQEMMRVVKQNGQVLIITYGSPQDRFYYFSQCLDLEKYEFKYKKCSLSSYAQMINLMRSDTFTNQPLDVLLKDPQKIKLMYLKMLLMKKQQQNQQQDFELINWEQIEQQYQQQQEQIINQEQQQDKEQIQEKQEKQQNLEKQDIMDIITLKQKINRIENLLRINNDEKNSSISDFANSARSCQNNNNIINILENKIGQIAEQLEKKNKDYVILYKQQQEFRENQRRLMKTVESVIIDPLKEKMEKEKAIQNLHPTMQLDLNDKNKGQGQSLQDLILKQKNLEIKNQKEKQKNGQSSEINSFVENSELKSLDQNLKKKISLNLAGKVKDNQFQQQNKFNQKQCLDNNLENQKQIYQQNLNTSVSSQNQSPQHKLINNKREQQNLIQQQLNGFQKHFEEFQKFCESQFSYICQSINNNNDTHHQNNQSIVQAIQDINLKVQRNQEHFEYFQNQIDEIKFNEIYKNDQFQQLFKEKNQTFNSLDAILNENFNSQIKNDDENQSLLDIKNNNNVENGYKAKKKIFSQNGNTKNFAKSAQRSQKKENDSRPQSSKLDQKKQSDGSQVKNADLNINLDFNQKKKFHQNDSNINKSIKLLQQNDYYKNNKKNDNFIQNSYNVNAMSTNISPKISQTKMVKSSSINSSLFINNPSIKKNQIKNNNNFQQGQQLQIQIQNKNKSFLEIQNQIHRQKIQNEFEEDYSPCKEQFGGKKKNGKDYMCIGSGIFPKTTSNLEYENMQKGGGYSQKTFNIQNHIKMYGNNNNQNNMNELNKQEGEKFSQSKQKQQVRFQSYSIDQRPSTTSGYSKITHIMDYNKSKKRNTITLNETQQKNQVKNQGQSQFERQKMGRMSSMVLLGGQKQSMKNKTKAQIFRHDPNFQNYKQIISIGKGNNSQLIKEIFQKKGWKIQQSSGKREIFFHLKWIQSYNLLPYDIMHEGSQIVNHIENIHIFTSKNGLLQLIKEYEEDPLFMKINSSSFFPESYILNLDKIQKSQDEITFFEETSKNEGIWIHKPWNLNCGGGIKMVGNLYNFKKEFQTLKQDSLAIQNGQNFYSNYFTQNCLKSVIQRYIDKPLLINNKKFDIRCYLLIACTKPLVVYYHKGYLRLSMDDYNLENFEKSEKLFTHLTNAAVQKQHKDYEKFKEDTIWSMEQFQEFCIKNYGKNQSQMEKIKDIIKQFLCYTIHIGEEKLQKKLGCFELMGVDILISENFRPYLIEMNSNPAIDIDTKVKAEIIPQVVENALNLVLEIHSQNGMI